MRIILFIITVIISFVSAIAQTTESPYDKGWGKVDKMFLDIYHDNWLRSSDTINVKWTSYGWGTSLLYDIPYKKGSKYSVAIGAGYAIHNVFTKAEVSIINHPDTVKGGDFSLFTPIDPARGVKKHKMVTNYIDVPIELRFRGKEDQYGNQFKFTLGIKGGYLLNIHTRYREGGYKHKNYVLPNANKFRYGTYMRIGYQRWTVYGYYSVSTMFNEDRGTTINPFSIGISFAIL